MTIVRSSSRVPFTAPLGLASSSTIVLPRFDVQQPWLSCISRPYCYYHMWVRSPSRRQNARALRHPLPPAPTRKGTLGRYPEHCACLFPCVNLHVHVPCEPFVPLTQGSLNHLSSARSTLGSISPFQDHIGRSHCSCHPVGDGLLLLLSSFMTRLISSSCPLAPGSIIPPSFSAKRASLQAPIFQLLLEHGNLSSSHSQLPCFQLLPPSFHLFLFALHATPFLHQAITFFFFLVPF